MKESRITCDTEIPISTNNGDHCSSSIRYHKYNLPLGKAKATTTTDKNRQQYDKPQKMSNDFSMDDTIGSTQGTTTTTTTTTSSCINDNNDQSSDKCYSGIRNYDIPKDTINSNILESKSHPKESYTPIKQPLLHGHHHQKHLGTSSKSLTRQPPPTIVLSPPDDASPEKVKVIFEYDNEKYPAQPNFLIRYKRIILSVAISLLIIFFLTFIVLMVYIAHRRRL